MKCSTSSSFSNLCPPEAFLSGPKNEMFSNEALSSGVQMPVPSARIAGGHGNFCLATSGSLLRVGDGSNEEFIFKFVDSGGYRCDVGDPVNIDRWVEVLELLYSSYFGASSCDEDDDSLVCH